MRAGAHALSMLSVPLNVHVLEALAEEPRSLVDLRLALGSPPQTTMRALLRALTEQGVLTRHRRNAFPGNIAYELAQPGRELLELLEILRQWLASSPQGHLALASPAAKSAVKALVEGWSTAIVRMLAATPLTLTELSKLITDLSYPSLERRLVAMRMGGLIQPRPGKGRGTPYVVTAWLRQAIAPIAASVRWERRHLPEETAPIRRLDIEAAFLLALPLVELTADRSGVCRLVVEFQNAAGDQRTAGAEVVFREGKVASCTVRFEGEAHASATGSAGAWLSAVIDGDLKPVELDGDRTLAAAVVEDLHRKLFGTPVNA